MLLLDWCGENCKKRKSNRLSAFLISQFLPFFVVRKWKFNVSKIFLQETKYHKFLLLARVCKRPFCKYTAFLLLKKNNVVYLETTFLLLSLPRSPRHFFQKSYSRQTLCDSNEKKLGRVNFWDFWSIADERVPSNDPRSNCETRFGSSSLLVS